MPNQRFLTPAAGIADVVRRHGLWTEDQWAAAAALEEELESLDAVRVVFGDPHGLARSKTLTAAGFRTVLCNGMDFSPGPFVFDTGHAVAVDFFAAGGGIGVEELTGAGDFIVVPDPLTFRVLPHTGRRTGWVIGDEYLRSAPVDSRTVICVLTHDEKFDVPALQAALATDAFYVFLRWARVWDRERRTC